MAKTLTEKWKEGELQEASEKDVGKLCWFWESTGLKHIGILEEILDSDSRPYWKLNDGCYAECRPLTKEEIKEFMEKAE